MHGLRAPTASASSSAIGLSASRAAISCESDTRCEQLEERGQDLRRRSSALWPSGLRYPVRAREGLNDSRKVARFPAFSHPCNRSDRPWRELVLECQGRQVLPLLKGT